jgi:hypothetical protein
VTSWIRALLLGTPPCSLLDLVQERLFKAWHSAWDPIVGLGSGAGNQFPGLAVLEHDGRRMKILPSPSQRYLSSFSLSIFHRKAKHQ